MGYEIHNLFHVQLVRIEDECTEGTLLSQPMYFMSLRRTLRQV